MRTGIATIRIPTKTAKWSLTPIGCVHDGNAACDFAALASTIRTIKDDPLHWTMLMGDLNDSITPQDKRWDPRIHNLYPPDGYVSRTGAKLVERFSPIRDKVLTVITGNHERRYQQHDPDKTDLTRLFCEKLELEYYGYSGMIYLNVEVPSKRYKSGHETAYSRKIYFHHGRGAATTEATCINSLRKAESKFDADIFIQAHNHRPYIGPAEKITVGRKGEMVALGKRFILTGTYLKTYLTHVSGYGEEAQYEPVVIGAPTLEVWMNRDNQICTRGIN